MSKPAAAKEVDRGKNGLGRYFRRFASALRRGSSGRGSGLAGQGQASSSIPPILEPAREEALSPLPRTRSDAEGEDGSAERPEARATSLEPSLSARSPARTLRIPSAQQRPVGSRSAPGPTTSYEKFQSMFAKYNLPMDQFALPTAEPDQTLRVEKQIRMRLRIVCHACGRHYSSSRSCPTCHHPRCRECERWPEKRPAGKKDPVKAKEKMREGEAAQSDRLPLRLGGYWSREAAEAAGLVVAGRERHPGARTATGLATVPARPKRKKAAVLNLPSRRGGQDLVRKPAQQRVHRFCCQCRRPFGRKSSQCESCQHRCCIRCPRDPAKLDKWPHGYPGDVIPPEAERPSRQWKKPRIRVRWTCHECRSLFADGEQQCHRCSHPRCDQCQREPPKRVARPVDPAVLESVQAKLAAVAASTKPPDPGGTSPALTSPSSTSPP